MELSKLGLTWCFVVTRYLDEEARFLAAVEKGIGAAERGEFIEEEEKVKG
jgi:predicted transcriptional regulator